MHELKQAGVECVFGNCHQIPWLITMLNWPDRQTCHFVLGSFQRGNSPKMVQSTDGQTCWPPDLIPVKMYALRPCHWETCPVSLQQWAADSSLLSQGEQHLTSRPYDPNTVSGNYS